MSRRSEGILPSKPKPRLNANFTPSMSKRLTNPSPSAESSEPWPRLRNPMTRRHSEYGGSGQVKPASGARKRELLAQLETLDQANKQTPVGPEPDWSIRLGAIKLRMLYELGSPLPLKEEPPKVEADGGQVADRLANKPGYRAAFRAYLDSLDRRDAEARAKAESEGRGGDGQAAASDPI